MRHKRTGLARLCAVILAVALLCPMTASAENRYTWREKMPPEDEQPRLPLPSPAMAARYTVRASSTGYFGDGSDGDLHIAAGQTVTLPVDTPYVSTVVRNYRSVYIEAGGVLTTSAPNAGLILNVQGDCTIKGTIDQNYKAPVINANNYFEYPPELKTGSGGSGGTGGAGITGTEKTHYPGSGGTGMTERSYGGGYGGGGGGGAGNYYYGGPANGGNGGSAANTDTSQINNLFIGGLGGGTVGGPGEHGGGGAGGFASYQSSRGGHGGTGASMDGDGASGGAGGGAGGLGGGVVIIYCGGSFQQSGSILCKGGDGGSGGSMMSNNNSRGAAGGGGGGGGGGGVYLCWSTSYSQTGIVNVDGGRGGAGGSAPYLSGRNGSRGNDGLVGKVVAKKAPDTTPPVISNVAVTSTWAATNTATIAATDDMTGVAEYAVTTTNAAPASGWQSGNGFTLAANGNYFAWAKDGLGNVSLGKAFTVSRVDNSKPTITSATVTPAGWANSATKTITIAASDGQSGIAGYGLTTNTTAPTSWQAANTFASAGGTFYVWAKDFAGNVSNYRQVIVDKIDTIKPAINSVSIPSAWGASNNITINASDSGGSSIAEFAVTADNVAPSYGWQSGNSFTMTANGSYYAWAKDGAGNISLSKSFTVTRVDKESPVVTDVVVPDTWAQSSAITVKATDIGVGVQSYAITPSNSAPLSGWQSGNSFTVADNGNYFAWAKDGAGNVSVSKAFLVSKVDKDKPVVESVAIPDEWAANSTVTLQAADTGSGIASYAVTVTSVQPRADRWQSATDFTLSANGYYYAWAMDLAGNISEGRKFVIDKVDTAAPIITEVEIPMDWGTDNTANILAEDAESGIADFAISSYSFAPSSGWQSSGSFTITRNGDYYAFAKDKAGNISASAKFTISKVDLDKPIITAVTMPTEWCTAGTLTISASDNSSIADYALSDSSAVPVKDWQSSSSFAITRNGSYYAWARDEVGNVSSGKFCYISKIDSTPPEISSITWSTSGDTVTVRGKDLASGVATVYIDDVAYSGSYATATLTEDVRYIRIVVEDIAGNKSSVQQERVPGWYDELETLTILPVEFTENNQQATITAASSGAAVKGIYVNDKLKTGNPVEVLVSHGTQYLEVQALDINGDRSILYQVRVPGWNAVVSTLEIVDVQFAEDNKTAKITAMESGGKGLKGIYVNGELFEGNPVVYDIPAGVQHLEMQAEDNFGDRSALLKRRVPGWSEIVTTMSITDVTYLDYNTTVQVTATATGGDTVSGIEVNGELQEGNPVIYKIPKGTETLKLQAVNSNGDRSPLVTKAVPKDATKGTLKIAIDEPSWTSSDKARVRVTVSDSSRITEVMARTSEDNEWVDITDSRYIFITADTTVYASVENEKGELRETSKEITCFDKVAPKVTATQDGNVVNIRATDDKSGVKSILVNNKVYSEQAIFNGKLAYRIPDGTSQITVYAEDAAGNLSSAVDLPLQVTVTAMPVIVSPEPETSSQPPQEVSLPEPESREEEAAEPTPEAPPVETEPVTPQTSPVAQATAAVGGIGTTAAGGIWYWLRKIRLNKPVEELELDGKKLLYDESEFGGAIDPDDSQGGN